MIKINFCNINRNICSYFVLFVVKYSSIKRKEGAVMDTNHLKTFLETASSDQIKALIEKLRQLNDKELEEFISCLLLI